MQITSNGGDDFAKLAAKFRAAGKDGAAVRKQLTKMIQAQLTKITDEQKSEARNMKVRGTKGKGTQRREAFHLSARLRGKNVRTRKAGYGLRASVAAGIKSTVTYTGRRFGAKIVVQTSQLPPSQRKLPRYLDSPRGWRHPVWGNRKKWVGQKGEPYFSGPIERHKAEVSKAVRTAVDNVMRTLT